MSSEMTPLRLVIVVEDFICAMTSAGSGWIDILLRRGAKLVIQTRVAVQSVLAVRGGGAFLYRKPQRRHHTRLVATTQELVISIQSHIQVISHLNKTGSLTLCLTNREEKFNETAPKKRPTFSRD
jgi:hypothetical protein